MGERVTDLTNVKNEIFLILGKFICDKKKFLSLISIKFLKLIVVVFIILIVYFLYKLYEYIVECQEKRFYY